MKRALLATAALNTVFIGNSSFAADLGARFRPPPAVSSVAAKSAATSNSGAIGSLASKATDREATSEAISRRPCWESPERRMPKRTGLPARLAGSAGRGIVGCYMPKVAQRGLATSIPHSFLYSTSNWKRARPERAGPLVAASSGRSGAIGRLRLNTVTTTLVRAR